MAILLCRDFLASDNDINTIPDEIGGMSNLQVLDFSNNRINNLPGTLGQLKVSNRDESGREKREREREKIL